jgi:peptidoglycan hydrolase-like protein with peptidoglycan-binding domain
LTALVSSGGILAAAAPATAQPPQLTGLLNQGSIGANVSRLQRVLHLRASGHYTAATKQAVLTYQRHHKLLVDGIVGPQTWDSLFHITPAPAATAVRAPSTPATAGTTPSTSSTGSYSIPSAIVQCESGGNYSAVNAQSGAGGAYQILPSTWAAYGGQGLPQDAPKAEQDRIAGEIYARQGGSAWTC